MGLKEAAQMALDALDSDNPDIQLRAATHLRAALAQPEQDPVWGDSQVTKPEIVAEQKAMNEGLRKMVEQEPVAWWHDMGDVVDLNVSGRGTPLYTAPPQREWIGLTDEEKLTIVRETDNPVDALAATEAKLREKNFDRPS